MEGTIKVTTSELKSAASDFSTYGSQIQTTMNSMMEKITALRSYWEGNASNSYINKFKQLQDDITRLVSMCTEHANDLTEMANVYDQYDQQAAELTSGLATEVIV